MAPREIAAGNVPRLRDGRTLPLPERFPWAADYAGGTPPASGPGYGPGDSAPAGFRYSQAIYAPRWGASTARPPICVARGRGSQSRVIRTLGISTNSVNEEGGLDENPRPEPRWLWRAGKPRSCGDQAPGLAGADAWSLNPWRTLAIFITAFSGSTSSVSSVMS
jgi:hypothetical protein